MNGRPIPDRYVVKANIEIDVKAWAEEYGLDAEQVPADARSYVQTTLDSVVGPFVSARVL